MGQLLGCVGQRLGAQDQDQEVKDAAITCTGACIARLGDLQPSSTSSLLQVLCPLPSTRDSPHLRTWRLLGCCETISGFAWISSLMPSGCKSMVT